MAGGVVPGEAGAVAGAELSATFAGRSGRSGSATIKGSTASRSVPPMMRWVSPADISEIGSSLRVMARPIAIGEKIAPSRRRSDRHIAPKASKEALECMKRTEIRPIYAQVYESE